MGSNPIGTTKIKIPEGILYFSRDSNQAAPHVRKALGNRRCPTGGVGARRRGSVSPAAEEAAVGRNPESHWGHHIELVASIDGATIFPLHKGDLLTIRKSKKSVRFAEFEKNYF